MREAELKAKSAIVDIALEYFMTDDEIECFYHKLILSLAGSCASWAEKKCAYQKNRT